MKAIHHCDNTQRTVLLSGVHSQLTSYKMCNRESANGTTTAILEIKQLRERRHQYIYSP